MKAMTGEALGVQPEETAKRFGKVTMFVLENSAGIHNRAHNVKMQSYIVKTFTHLVNINYWVNSPKKSCNQAKHQVIRQAEGIPGHFSFHCLKIAFGFCCL